MFDHVGIGVVNLELSKAFFLGALRPLGTGVFILPVALSLMLAACADVDDGGASPAMPGEPPVGVPAADAWLGRWTGPEGTYLDIDGGGGRYELTIANLDGPRRFAGAAEGASIVFQRDGRRETLRSTDGAGTGMKWLAEETNCLVVVPGEGFCRP